MRLMMSKSASIVCLARVSEVGLIALAYLIAWLSEEPIVWNPSVQHVTIGALSAVPLLGCNHLLWKWTQRNPDSIYSRFSRQVVLPLCRAVTIRDAALIALLSGIGEEVLFRGALNTLIATHTGNLLALFVTSILFAYVHFIGHLKQFGAMIPLYSIVGAILWMIWRATNSLTAVATAHATYNFAAIATMKYLDGRDAARSNA
jgi:hypothetical protein